ncbi:hypothetical protein HRbin20_01559 [bacterium HR20]|nr:hypothetical protein HRbin20_01559 [bacterium HR20]
MERNIERRISKENARQPSRDKRRDKTNGIEHRGRKANIPLPERPQPVERFDRRRDRNDERCNDKCKAEPWIHPADEHVVTPHDETQECDGDQGADHHFVPKDRLTSTIGENFRGNAHCRQNEDVHFWMPQEPEQVLPEQGAATIADDVLTAKDKVWEEKARAQVPIKEQEYCTSKERRKCKKTQDRSNDNAPDRQRHPHERHPFGAHVECSRHIVQTAHRRSNDEQRNCDEPQVLTKPRTRRCFRERTQWRIGRPSSRCCTGAHKKGNGDNNTREEVEPVAEHVQERKRHITCTDLERDEEIPKAAGENCRKQEKDHDRAVHGHEHVISWCLESATLHVCWHQEPHEGQVVIRPCELDPEDPRHHHADKSHDQRSDHVLHGDDFVILAEDILRPETLGLVVMCLDCGLSVGYNVAFHCRCM